MLFQLGNWLILGGKLANRNIVSSLKLVEFEMKQFWFIQMLFKLGKWLILRCNNYGLYKRVIFN